MWEKRQKSIKKQCSVESSKWSPMKLNEFEIFSTEFWKCTWFILVYGGTYGLPCKFCEKCLKPGSLWVLRPPTWTFAGHQSPSYQTYSDVKRTSRKPSINSAILEVQMLDLSRPGYVYKQSETWFFLAWPNRAILRGSKAVRPRMVLTLFWIGFNRF